jgi:hypothetical protein
MESERRNPENRIGSPLGMASYPVPQSDENTLAIDPSVTVTVATATAQLVPGSVAQDKIVLAAFRTAALRSTQIVPKLFSQARIERKR